MESPNIEMPSTELNTEWLLNEWHTSLLTILVENFGFLF